MNDSIKTSCNRITKNLFLDNNPEIYNHRLISQTQTRIKETSMLGILTMVQPTMSQMIQNNIQTPAIYTGPDQLYVSNGQGLHISFHSNSDHFKLNNILHVPSITKNLLSIHKFTLDNNLYVEFYPNFCMVKDIHTHQLLMKREHKDGLYLLHFL